MTCFHGEKPGGDSANNSLTSLGCWKVGFSFVVHKTFQELYSRTGLQQSPSQPQEMGTCFKPQENTSNKFKNAQKLTAPRSPDAQRSQLI